MNNNKEEVEDYGLTEKQLIGLLGIERAKNLIESLAGCTIAIVNEKEVFYYCDIIGVLWR